MRGRNCERAETKSPHTIVRNGAGTVTFPLAWEEGGRAKGTTERVVEFQIWGQVGKNNVSCAPALKGIGITKMPKSVAVTERKKTSRKHRSHHPKSPQARIQANVEGGCCRQKTEVQE